MKDSDGMMLINKKDYNNLMRYEKDGIIIDTGTVKDGVMDYEVAVSHPDYNEGHMIIVGAYATESEAIEGHNFWTGVMTGKNLPSQLTDVCNAHISRLAKDLGATVTHPRIPKFGKENGYEG